MRYSNEHKDQTRAKVLDAAARAIRAEGPDRVAVAGLMAEAGLTHGGFYAHFKSKDELVVCAIARMFEQTRGRLVSECEGRSAAAGLAAYIDFYLSAKHRDSRETGCPIAALSSDLPRLSEAARAAFADGVRRLGVAIGAKLAELDRGDVEGLAHSTVAELVGALSLARIEPDAKRSNTILANSKRQLKRRLGLDAQP